MKHLPPFPLPQAAFASSDSSCLFILSCTVTGLYCRYWALGSGGISACRSSPASLPITALPGTNCSPQRLLLSPNGGHCALVCGDGSVGIYSCTMHRADVAGCGDSDGNDRGCNQSGGSSSGDGRGGSSNSSIGKVRMDMSVCMVVSLEAAAAAALMPGTGTREAGARAALGRCQLEWQLSQRVQRAGYGQLQPKVNLSPTSQPTYAATVTAPRPSFPRTPLDTWRSHP